MSQQYVLRVAKLAQNATEAEGQAALELLASVPTPPAVGANGEGSLINTHA